MKKIAIPLLVFFLFYFTQGCGKSEIKKVDRLQSLLDGKCYRHVITAYDSILPSLKSPEQKNRAISLYDSARAIVSQSTAFVASADSLAKRGFALEAYRLYTLAMSLEPTESTIVKKRSAVPATGKPIYRWSGTINKIIELKLTYHTKWVNNKLLPDYVQIQATNNDPFRPVFLVDFVPFLKYVTVSNYKMQFFQVSTLQGLTPVFRKPFWRGKTMTGQVSYNDASIVNNNSALSYSEVFKRIMLGNDKDCFIFLVGYQYVQINGFTFLGYEEEAMQPEKGTASSQSSSPSNDDKISQKNDSTTTAIKGETAAKDGTKNKKGFKEYINKEDGSILIEVPAGSFTMGSNESDDEKPTHAVYLDKYYIGKYEVTVGQFKKFCNAKGITMPEQPTWNNRDDHPVVNVSWNAAKAYCDWAGLRLPTEAEWEKAARGTDSRKYPWGNEWNSAKCNSDEKGDNYENTSPVGSFPSGVSPYGAYDMAGNVWEWCNDWYGSDYYSSSPSSNPTGPSFGSHRVLRGGSLGYGGIVCLSDFRGGNYPYPDDGDSDLGGFRPAK